jgi:hypothetical protein
MSEIELPEVELLYELDHIANDWEYGLPTHDDSLMDKMREAVREYGKACARAAMERAAQIADAERAEFMPQAANNNGSRESDFAFGSVNSAERIAAAIRAEKEETP